MSKKTHYDILKVPTDASFAEIKRSYKAQAGKLKNRSGKRAQAQLHRLEESYTILSDKSKRRAYDRIEILPSQEVTGQGSNRHGEVGFNTRPKRTRPHRPIASALKLVWLHKWLWLRIALIAIVVDLVLVISAPMQGGGIGQNIWLAILVSVFIWVAGHLSEKDTSITARTAYYKGSHAFVKQFLLLMFWAICLLPFIIGSLVYTEITVVAFAATSVEQVSVGVLWFVLSALSLYLVLRTIFAVVLIHETAPVDAIKKSWRMTKSRVWWLGKRIVGWGLLAFVPVLIVYAISLSRLITNQLFLEAGAMLADAFILLVTLPVLATIIDQVYEHEKPRRVR